MRSQKNYYRILEVEHSASTEEIKKAYRKLALKHHPDKNDGDPLAELRFKEIHEAYHILSDLHRRSAYNQKRWYNRHTSRQKEIEALSPQELLVKSAELVNYLNKLPVHHVNRKALSQYVLYLLSEPTLQQPDFQSANSIIEMVITTLLPVTHRVEGKEAIEIISRLKRMKPGEALNHCLDKRLKASRMQANWEKYQHLLLLLLSIILCWLIFIIS
jgi:curved DNA-binding protein CbpA